MRGPLLTSLLLSLVSADVTIIPTNVTEPREFRGQSPVTSNNDIVTNSASSFTQRKGISILLSSMPRLNVSDGIRSSSDSFVRGTIEAWAGHQHLVIRPEHVWFSILVQMNFYMAKHADDEAVRKTFVTFSGKQDMRIIGRTLGEIIPLFQHEIQKRVKTEWLLDWIQPNFSTSTKEDNLTANILMMGLMKGYFNYIAGIVCGIPSITLQGELSDWERLHQKLDRLPVFGKEPADYAAKLRPVLSRFVRSFKAPHDPETRQFWQNIVSVSINGGLCGVSPYYVNGWINAFHHWDAKGNLLRTMGNSPRPFTLDGIAYPWRDIKDFPTAYATVPIKVEDNGLEYNVTALAGMVGKKIKQEIPKGYGEALRKVEKEAAVSALVNRKDHWTLEPVSAWFVFRDLETSNDAPPVYGKSESWPGVSTCGVSKQLVQPFSPFDGEIFGD